MITHTYIDRQSGATLDRPQLRQMLQDADRRKFDVLLFWKLDRLARSGILDTLQILEQLKRAGIEYHSLTEPIFRSRGHLAEMAVSLYATFAALERDLIAERTAAGVARAKAAGKKLGRPARVIDRRKLEDAITESPRPSLADLARRFNTSKMTVARRLAEIEKRKANGRKPGEGK